MKYEIKLTEAEVREAVSDYIRKTNSHLVQNKTLSVTLNATTAPKVEVTATVTLENMPPNPHGGKD